MHKTILITGATSGLGLALAQRLSTQSGLHLVLPVRNAQRAEQLRAALPHASLSTPLLDLARLDSVRSFAPQLSAPLDAVLFNAGVQSADAVIRTADDLEQSFAVNHLAHHVLLRALEPLLQADAIIGWTASGTHDPQERLASRFGFTGAHYLAPEALAQGQYASAPDAAQINRDAYASSKGLNVLSARHFAAREPGQRRYFSYDPGLMAGTGLAREQGVLKGTSSPQGSAQLLARILLGQHALPNGAYVEFSGTQNPPHVPPREAAYTERLMAFSDSYR
jgi:NAD(P)-dependent dehydrogenase (short-subunit alcohol dehydrogenase family)